MWAVTLGKTGFVRLNIGVIEVLAFFANSVHLILDQKDLTEGNRDMLIQLGAKPGGRVPIYPRVPSSEMWDIPARHIKSAIPLFRHSYENLIEYAAESVRWRTGYYIYHSSGMLEYLRSSLNCVIPEPNYTKGHIHILG